MAAYGTPVVYEGNDGDEPLAFVATKEGGANADLAVMNKNGVWAFHKDVARRDEGGGHTWRPKQ